MKPPATNGVLVHLSPQMPDAAKSAYQTVCEETKSREEEMKAMILENPDDHVLREILETARTIAVVGLSPDPSKDSHHVAAYLQRQGYRIIPVNPAASEILGEKSWPDLVVIPDRVDVVDVFRRPEHVLPIAEQAITIGAKVLWLQLGVRNDDAARRAEEAGLVVVQDRCMLREHRRLLGK